VKAPIQRHLRLLPRPPQRLAPRACEIRLTNPVTERELSGQLPVAEPELREQRPASIPPRLVEAQEPVPV